MLKQFALTCFVFYFSINFLVKGKFLNRIEKVDGVVKAYAYKETAEEENDWTILCSLQYNNSYSEIGWDTVEVQTNSKVLPDVEQAKCAGFLEGVTTCDAIIYHYRNTIKPWCRGREKTCKKVEGFLNKHLKWINETIKKKQDKDPIWHHVDVIYSHIRSIYDGYVWWGCNKQETLKESDFIMMNLLPDLDDVAAAIEGDASTRVKGETHCSAIIKLLPNNKDLLVGHNTWTKYTNMYRMVKKYIIPLHMKNSSTEKVPTAKISFSGYPGVITSSDDFYTTNSGLVALETTIGNSNASLWKHVKPTGQLFESVRSLIALRLAKSGKSWCKVFSQYNSGTYNNQWIILDNKKFKSGTEPQPGMLWVLEQIPGYVRYEDQTNTLVKQTYWPSYNVPFYEDVFNLSGNQELVNQYGDWFSYNNTPRALIFKRDHFSVKDLSSLMALLRSNNYQNDEYAKCNCTPPYSAENAIAARSDLNPKRGQYPFPALGHRPHGAIDAKVCNSSLAANLAFIAVCGPTTGSGLPPFRWNESDFQHLPHEGQPNSFENFYPWCPEWQEPLL